MLGSIRWKTAVSIAIGMLAGYAAVGVFAAPGATPWPDFFSDGPRSSAGIEPCPVETPLSPPADIEPCLEESTPTDEIEPTETDDVEEPTEVIPAETPEVEGPDEDDGRGVPLDSPACQGTLEDPNPHDTDGDGDGCDIVDGKNLPDPAADAHEGNPGTMGNGHDGDGDRHDGDDDEDDDDEGEDEEHEEEEDD